ncbi:AraC family transcriptional regulator [Burkholderia plantarii]|uniref:Transcriptional regulator, AraC family n=1 Tax=Burkholderia plantarii TaxID=41899 RepID=A0A0B6RV23_BURPL|nr:helix-turn-helix domain-containing protein [Burkholderia plantarii]AJK46024.1 transcriptional regulator, AraC family [Burkholderia plantarii]
MPIDTLHRKPATHRPVVPPVIDALFGDECLADTPKVAIPRPELHLVVRFGPSANRGLDIHVLGARQRVMRKVIRKGQRTIVARLQLGMAAAVLGAPPCAFNDRVVPLEAVWHAAETQHLYDELAAATDDAEAATSLARAIAARLSPGDPRPRHASLVGEAARKLLGAKVGDVAADLRISERQLRRVFLDAVGMGPKRYARLMRFARATELAREGTRADWAGIAVAAGYYDQAHLIEDFQVFAGTTPEAFRRELDGTGMPVRQAGAA